MMFVGWIWLVWNPSWRMLAVIGLVIVAIGALVTSKEQSPEQLATGAVLSAALFYSVGALIVALRKRALSKQDPLLRSLT